MNNSQTYLRLLVKYAAEDRLGKLVAAVRRKPVFDPPPPPGAKPVATTGQSGKYFKTDTHFYKAVDPMRAPHSHLVEPNATAAMAKLGNTIPQTTHEVHGGVNYLKSPLLGPHKELSQGPETEEHTPHDEKGLHRLALSNYLIHAGDRHGGNYALVEGNPTPVPVDYGKTFHPDTAHGGRDVGWKSDDYLKNHITADTQIHPDVLRDVIDRAPSVLPHLEAATSELSPWKRAEARQLYDEKLQSLKDAASGDGTFGSLPAYFGARKQS